MKDNVNHPQHYTSHPSGIECIQISSHYDFCVGNAIKYLWRAGLKKDASLQDKQKEIEDLEKAVWYINYKIKMLRNESQNNNNMQGTPRLRKDHLGKRLGLKRP